MITGERTIRAINKWTDNRDRVREVQRPKCLDKDSIKLRYYV